MDTIETRCPHCQALFRLPPEQFATVVRCGRCRETFTPTATASDAPPPLPAPEPPLLASAPARMVARSVARRAVLAESVVASPEPTPIASRLKERKVRPDRDDDDRPRRKFGGGGGVLLMVAMIAVVGLVLLGVAGGVAWLIYDERGQDTAATVVEHAEKPAPPKMAEPPARDAEGNAVGESPRTQPIRVATVGVWAPGQTSLGSGFVAGPPGHIVTSSWQFDHRLNVRVSVVLGSGKTQRTVMGEVVRLDTTVGLALIKVDDSNPPSPVPIAGGYTKQDGLIVRVYGYTNPDPAELDKGPTVSQVRVVTVGPAGVEGSTVTFERDTLKPGHTGGPVSKYDGTVIGMCFVQPSTGDQRVIPADRLTKFLKAAQATPPGGTAPGAGQPPVGPTGMPPRLPGGGGPTGMPPTPPAPPAAVNFPPVTLLPIEPAPLKADKSEYQLPSTVAEACVGGGGRYFILHLPKKRQLAIFDVIKPTGMRYLPMPADDITFAAGMNKLLVVSSSARTVSRYDLVTGQREQTVPLPVTGTIKQAVMGSASAGPLMLTFVPTAGVPYSSDTVAFLDPATLKPIQYTRSDMPKGAASGLGLRFSDRDSMHFRASPNGKIFAIWCTSHSQGLQTLVLSGNQAKLYSGEMAGITNPTDEDGLVSGGGILNEKCQKIAGDNAEPRYRLRVPARTGRFYLTCPGGGGAQHNTGRMDEGKPVQVYLIGDARPIATLKDVELPASNEAWTGSDFNQDKRVHFVPEAKLIAIVPPSNDRIILHRFDLEAELEKSGINYLYVTSHPPPAIPGKPFDYPIKVRSKKGGVKFKLDAGPDGMTVSPDGRLTWAVPARFDPVSVIVTVSDTGGQEVFHSFPLVAADPVTATATPMPLAGPRPEPLLPTSVTGGEEHITTPKTVLPIKPTRAADGATVRLPAAADEVCVGGGGRFLIFRLPKTRQIALFDTTAGEVVKSLPMAEDNALIAAGMNKLYVLNPTANVIQRWSLTTFEKEKTVPNPVGGTPKRMLMGHATDGPLYIGGTGVTKQNHVFLDTSTFQAIKIEYPPNRHGPGISDNYPPQVRVSADGRVYAWWTPGVSPMGLYSLEFTREGTKSNWKHDSAGAILPGPDGTLFTAAGLYTPELNPVGGTSRPYQYWYLPPIPATEGPWYIDFENPETPGGNRTTPRRKGTVPPSGGAKPPRASLKKLGDSRPIVTLPSLPNLGPKDGKYNANQTGQGLQFYDRIHLIPPAGLLVVVSEAGDQLHLHRFNIEEQLEKSGHDFLLVTSRPPFTATRGQVFTYKPTVLSKKGGVKVKLEAGPVGMDVNAAADQVSWSVPKDFDKPEANVILLVTDASGQEVYHTFRLTVRDGAETTSTADPATTATPPSKRPECDALPYEQVAHKTNLMPCPLKEDVVELPLPSPASKAAVVGGGGRFLILHLPEKRQLAIFDTREGKIAKFLPVADDKPLFAAGQSYLVVYAPSVNAFVTYELATFKKHATIVSPVKDIQALGMGSAEFGPVFVLSKTGTLTLHDPNTFRQYDEVKDARLIGHTAIEPPQVEVDEHCQMIGGAAGAFAKVGNTYKPVQVSGYARPTPDGHAFLTPGRLLTPDGKLIGEWAGGNGRAVWTVPAAQGPYYLSLNQVQDKGKSALELRVHLSTETRSIVTLPRGEAVQQLIDWHSGQAQPFDRHVVFYPDAHLLVVIPKARDQLVLYRVDMEDLLAKSDIDYLMVTSHPPDSIDQGREFSYAPAVWSKKGKARIRLESGPADMKLADGSLSWNVPRNQTEPVPVVLSVTDASGQEVFHSFTLTVRGRELSGH